MEEQILEKQVLMVVKAVEDKIDDEIAALDRLDIDNIEVLRERRLQQMKKMAKMHSRLISLGHGDYSEIPSKKDFFVVVKARYHQRCTDAVQLETGATIVGDKGTGTFFILFSSFPSLPSLFLYSLGVNQTLSDLGLGKNDSRHTQTEEETTLIYI